MEQGNPESVRHAQPIPVYLAPNDERDDAVSLVDILRVLRRRKGLVLLGLLVSMLLATAYILIAKPVYQAETQLLPPRQQDIQGLLVFEDSKNAEESEGERYTTTEVFQRLTRNLKSQGLRREFFDQNNLLDWYLRGQRNDKSINVDKIFETQFNRSFEVSSNKVDPSFLVVRFSHTDPELVATWLNGFVAFASKRTIEELSESVNIRIQAEIRQLRMLLSAMLKTAAIKKHDRIMELKEALHIARALGINDSSGFPVISERNSPGIAVNTAQVPLYMRGVKALNEEITGLEARESEEAFIVGFREKQEELSLLESISIDRDKLSATKIDVMASKPYNAEKPRNKVVFLLSAVLGLLGGIILVYIAEIVSKVRQEQEQHRA